MAMEMLLREINKFLFQMVLILCKDTTENERIIC